MSGTGYERGIDQPLARLGGQNWPGEGARVRRRDRSLGAGTASRRCARCVRSCRSCKMFQVLWIQKFTALAMRFERGAVRVIRPARKEKRTATPRGLKKMIRTPPTTMESLESQHFLRCCAAADDDSLANRLEAPTFVYSRVESREPTAED